LHTDRGLPLLSNADVEKRDKIIEQALKAKEPTKQTDVSPTSADYALEEATEIGRTEERSGMESALKAARESEQQRRSRAIFASLFAFISFIAAALIGGGTFGLFALSTEMWLGLLGLGALGFAILVFYILR